MTASLREKLIAGFVLAFLAGSATGAFFTFHHVRHWRTDFGHHPYLLTERIRDRIQGQLNLTPEQMTQIKPILDHASQQLQDIRADTGARVRQVMADIDHALQPELTETQRAKLKAIQHTGWEKRGPHNSLHRRGGREKASPADDPVAAPSR